MHYEHHRYVGKVCVVTGAANGLGLNLVNRLVEEGDVYKRQDQRGSPPGYQKLLPVSGTLRHQDYSLLHYTGIGKCSGRG